MAKKSELDDMMSYILYHDKNDWEYYSFYIWDRVSEEIVLLPVTNIIKIYGRHFIVLNEDNSTAVVPMHRIRKIFKNKELVFERDPEHSRGK